MKSGKTNKTKQNMPTKRIKRNRDSTEKISWQKGMRTEEVVVSNRASA